MTRCVLVPIALAVAAAVLLGLLGSVAGAPIGAACRAAWLAVLAVPLGALVLVLGREALGLEETPLAGVLRGLLALLPPAAALGVAVLLLAPLPPLPPAVASIWMAPVAMQARSLVALAAWVGFALIVRRPPTRPGARTSLARAGLGLHVVLVTLTTMDWIWAADPALVSSVLGLVVVAAQAAAAMAVACLMPGEAGRAARIALLLLFAAWLALAFTQYLVVWSANMPAEAGWYLRRGGALGQAAGWAALAVLAAGLAAQATASGLALRVVAAAVLVLTAGSMAWLVTPGSRGAFSIDLADVVALVGVIALAVAVARLRTGRTGLAPPLGAGGTR